MLALPATLLPPLGVIPVQGIVRIGRKLGRAGLLRRAAARLVSFAAGSAPGTGLGTLPVAELSKGPRLLPRGIFLPLSSRGSRQRPRAPPAAFVPVGSATSFVGTFLSATRPFVAASRSPERLGHSSPALFVPPARASDLVDLDLASSARVCPARSAVRHPRAVGAAEALRFAFLPGRPRLGAMVGFDFVGTTVGTRRLDRLPGRRFAEAFRFVLARRALSLVREGPNGPAGPEREISSGGLYRGMVRAWPSPPAPFRPSP